MDTPTPGSGEPPLSSPPPTDLSLPPAPAAGPRQISGFWRRLAAFLIDSLILGAAGMVLGVVFFDQFAALGSYGRLIGFVIAVGYFGILNSSLGSGRTIGKRVLGIEVVGPDGGRIGIGRALVRAVVLTVPFFLNGVVELKSGDHLLIEALASLVIMVLGFSIIYLFIFNRRTRQSAHDLATGTYVVRASGTGPVVAQPTWRPHFAVIGVIGICALAMLYITPWLTGSGLFADLLVTRERILATGKVHDAGVVLGRSYAWRNGVSSITNTLSVNAVWKTRPADYEAAAADVARVTLAAYRDASKQDGISVTITYGYDIGIARFWIGKTVNHTPAEWRTILEGVSNKVTRT